MSERIQAIRGMNDTLPETSYGWRTLETRFANCLTSYGYQEIRLPLLENTQLFKRSIGEVTDIVEKEMYTFTDLNGDSLSLRPEGTAGCVRACLEHGLLHHQQQKLWYCGPMFRHEKPQKGRYRQFYQFGVEAFGFDGISIELELISICKRLWEQLGISDALQLQINTLGSLSERQTYRQTLVEYFKPHFEQLDEDSQRRLNKNPLRILDSKNPAMIELISGAPKLMDVMSDESRQSFFNLCHGLDMLGIKYQVNPLLVRGLDYYGHTVFEWVTDRLGSQATVCAGGRFDKLIEQLGGQPTPAIGFAIGIERLLLLMDTLQRVFPAQPKPLLFMLATSEEGHVKALAMAEQIRNKEPDWLVQVNHSGGSFKSQFKKADKSGARLALILGEDEMQNDTISIKDLREGNQQERISVNEFIPFIKKYLQ